MRFFYCLVVNPGDLPEAFVFVVPQVLLIIFCRDALDSVIPATAWKMWKAPRVERLEFALNVLVKACGRQ